MKKLSLIIALALIVSVGGVYATWNYAENTMTTVTHEFKNLGITDANTNTVSGTVAVTDTLILKIDDEGDYRPGWDSDVQDSNGGNIQLVFTPNPGADDVTIKWTITVAKNSYDPGTGAVAIFAVNGNKTAHDTAEEVLSGTFTFTAGSANATTTITLAQVKAALAVNGDFTLPTLDDYTAYKTALNNVELNLVIEEVTTP